MIIIASNINALNFLNRVSFIFTSYFTLFEFLILTYNFRYYILLFTAIFAVNFTVFKLVCVL